MAGVWVSEPHAGTWWAIEVDAEAVAKHYSNNYGLGEDDLFVPGRKRIHTDNSIEVKYFDRPDNVLDKMAFSLTGDLGCEYGGGVSCYGNKKGGPKQSFVGYMAYNRFWFHHDLFGLTV